MSFRLDPNQELVVRAIQSGCSNVLCVGPGGSGKTAAAKKALEKTPTLFVAVATCVALRFGGADALNTMELYHVLKQYCNRVEHRLVRENPTCRKIFGPNGLLPRGLPFAIAIDEAGMMSGHDLEKIVSWLWKAATRHGNAREKFNRCTWVFLGDPERQLPNISGTPFLKSPVFHFHESGFHNRLISFELNGMHRFTPDAREFITHIEDAFSKNDLLLLNAIVRMAKARYQKYPPDDLFYLRHFVATRLEAETYLKRAAAALFGEAVDSLTTEPGDNIAPEEKTRSEYTAATYSFPTSLDFKILLQAVSPGQHVKAKACDDLEDVVDLPNRTVISVAHGAISDLPRIYPDSRAAAASTVSFYYEGADRVAPMFTVSQKNGKAKPVWRQVGFVDSTGKILTSVELLYNAQGCQCDGEKIVVGTENCLAPITGTFLYVALTRTNDPGNDFLLHPGMKISFTKEDYSRRQEMRSLLANLLQKNRQVQQTRRDFQPKRRRLSCLLPSFDPDASSS